MVGGSTNNDIELDSGIEFSSDQKKLLYEALGFDESEDAATNFQIFEVNKNVSWPFFPPEISLSLFGINWRRALLEKQQQQQQYVKIKVDVILAGLNIKMSGRRSDDDPIAELAALGANCSFIVRPGSFSVMPITVSLFILLPLIFRVSFWLKTFLLHSTFSVESGTGIVGTHRPLHE